jgi:hypothetical protein
MTDAEYHEKMRRTNHSNTCSWGWDQYWWECDCGAIPVAELRVEQERRGIKPTPKLR